MSIYLEEQTLNSLYSLCNKSFQSNESYEDKIKILKSEKVLLNDGNYTNNKGVLVVGDGVDATLATDGVLDGSYGVEAVVVDGGFGVFDNNPQNAVIIIPSPPETNSEKLNAFFIDGNYVMNVILLPAAGLVNGYVNSNIPTRISSERSITTKELLQKNVRSVNDQLDRDIIVFTSFNRILDSVSVNPGDGSSMVGNFSINNSNDRCEVRYIGYQEQHDNIVRMVVLWEKSPNGTYFIKMYITNDNYEIPEFTGMYSLTKIA